MRENAVYRYLARFGQAVSETGPLIFEWPGYRYFALTRSGTPGGRALPNPRGEIDDSGITTLGASGGVGRRSGVGRWLSKGVGLGVGVASDAAKAYTLLSAAT